MRKIFRLIMVSALFGLVFVSTLLCQDAAVVTGKEGAPSKQECVLGKKADSFPFYVYKDYKSEDNKYFATGNMGDYGDMEVHLDDMVHQYSGTSCVQIEYKVGKLQSAGWAGLFWQYPANNWGGTPGGYDLTGAKRLTFWAKGAKGGEIINTFQVGGIHGKNSDSGVKAIGKIVLSTKWQKYTIDLATMDDSIIVDEYNKGCWPFMAPLSRIVGGFGWATSMSANYNEGIVFYLDEIRFEND